MTKIIFEGKLTPDTVDIEDSGLAMIAEPQWKVQGGDDSIFVRIQSWDETVNDDDNYDAKQNKVERANGGHKSMNSLIGKNIRVTIEVIDEC